jgi:Flp pilus assembly protein TadG
MLCLRIPHPRFSIAKRSLAVETGLAPSPLLLKSDQGSALLEFAIVLPLLVVFVVGIYDFSGAFNQKQKIEQAAQEGAIFAGAQPMSDIEPANANPDSLQPVVVAIFNSLAASGVLPNANTGGTCTMPPPAPSHTAPVIWVYQISGCNRTGDQLTITINRGWVHNTGGASGTVVTVTNPYHWQFNSVIQVLISGASYAAITQLTESATVQNQM